jgi:hypothetical protein
MPCVKHDTCQDCRTQSDQLLAQQMYEGIQAVAIYILVSHHNSLGIDALRAQIALVLGLTGGNEAMAHHGIDQMLERGVVTLARGNIILSNKPLEPPKQMPQLDRVRVFRHKLEKEKVRNTRTTYKVWCVRCKRRRQVILPLNHEWQDNDYIEGHCWPWAKILKPKHRGLEVRDFTFDKPA